MGQRGPRPIPNALKKLRGSRIRKNHQGPTPPTATPTPPAHLSKEAALEWRRITPELAALGLLSQIDRAALSCYCQSWGRWCEAEKMIIETGGTIVKSPSGYPIQNPHLSIANKAMKQCEGFIKEFGLSPSSRTRVQATPQVNEENDKFLKMAL